MHEGRRLSTKKNVMPSLFAGEYLTHGSPASGYAVDRYNERFYPYPGVGRWYWCTELEKTKVDRNIGFKPVLP